MTDGARHPRGTLGALGPGGVPVAAHPVWGSVTPPCLDRGRGAWASRAASAGPGPWAARAGPIPCRERLGGSCTTTSARPPALLELTGSRQRSEPLRVLEVPVEPTADPEHPRQHQGVA